MKATKKIRTEPGHAEMKCNTAGKFTIEFFEWRGDAQLKVAVTLEDWWLSILARFASEIVAKREKEAETLKAGIEAAFHEHR